MRPARPHVLGIDDGPFDKHRDRVTPLVGVITEGADLVEGVVVSELPIDGDGVTAFLADWIDGLRFRPGLQAVVLGGVTLAGLSVVDLTGLADRTGLPVLAVNRKDPTNHRVHEALQAAGLAERAPLVDRTPPSFPVGDGLFAAAAGIEPDAARVLLANVCGKSALPEALRLAHLIAAAIVRGSSRGRA